MGAKTQALLKTGSTSPVGGDGGSLGSLTLLLLKKLKERKPLLQLRFRDKPPPPLAGWGAPTPHADSPLSHAFSQLPFSPGLQPPRGLGAARISIVS